MNARTLVVGVLAVVCGLSAVVLVQAMRKPPSGPVIEKVAVVFAAADVQPGETIQEAMLESREIPKTEVPDDAILKISDAIDRAAMTSLDKGDLLRGKKLAERGAGRGMAALIKTGMRAITIPTPSVSTSMAGFLLPGNHVDILLTTTSSGGSGDASGGATTSTLLQNVEILAVHTTVNAPTANKIDPEQARSVTVQVTPEDASRLQLAQTKGTLHLSLRNQKDNKDEKNHSATLADIQVHDPVTASPPVVAAPEPPKVEAPRDLAQSIPPGMRAFTITTPTHSRSMVKTIRAGHRVDVLLTVNLKDDNKVTSGNESGSGFEGVFQGHTQTLLQDQEVLQIHPAIDPSAASTGTTEEIRAITLLVSPKDAELLDLAENAGKLHLSLRPEGQGYSTSDDSRPDPVTNADLLGSRKNRDSPFSMVTLEVRTLRGTASGADSMSYAVRRSSETTEGKPRTKSAPVPSRKTNQNLVEADTPRKATSSLMRAVGASSKAP